MEVEARVLRMRSFSRVLDGQRVGINVRLQGAISSESSGILIAQNGNLFKLPPPSAKKT